MHAFLLRHDHMAGLFTGLDFTDLTSVSRRMSHESEGDTSAASTDSAARARIHARGQGCEHAPGGGGGEFVFNHGP